MPHQRCLQELACNATQPFQWSWCGVASKSDCLSCYLSASRCSFAPRDRGGHCWTGNKSNRCFATCQSLEQGHRYKWQAGAHMPPCLRLAPSSSALSRVPLSAFLAIARKGAWCTSSSNSAAQRSTGLNTAIPGRSFCTGGAGHWRSKRSSDAGGGWTAGATVLNARA